MKSDAQLRAYFEAFDISPGELHRNLPATELVARSLARGEGRLAANGALVVETGARTGRSPEDRFIVDGPAAKDVAWGGANRSCTREFFDRMLQKAADYLRGREAFVFDGFAGADAAYRLPIRVLTTEAWHSLFAGTLFLQPQPVDLDRFAPGFTLINCGKLLADPEVDGTRSDTFVGLDLDRKIILVVGSCYAGEMKKAVFTVLNYLLPASDVLPMHCAASVGERGDVALFFGLSGTGKTTLSADPTRRLIGDDEHGWSTHGIFNFEGGCYAKVIRLSAEAEPQIFHAIRFGSVLENAVVDPQSCAVQWDDDAITENTRGSYSLDHIPGAVPGGLAGMPQNVFFLACDSYGVLPPLARLTPEMAAYHFLSGFTAKVAGTELGVTDPVPTFSACFGAPFMPRRATVYADMLAERLREYGATCWLVNTGWTGGPYGVGSRMPIALSRSLLRAAVEGKLDDATFTLDPVFNVEVPDAVEGVDPGLLHPRSTWADQAAYDEQASKLAAAFAENFTKYTEFVSPEVAAAGPRASR